MQSNTRKVYPGRPRSSSSNDDTKPARKVHTRRIPYVVGYSWNKGGRLKELRIRHLARKFLKIWLQNTFGRVLPHRARSHYKRALLRRAFEGWKDEWWTFRREWSLTVRAECHYRYYLCHMALQNWRKYRSLQRDKKSKIQNAQSFGKILALTNETFIADRQRMRLVWDKWEVFTEMRQMKRRMLCSALELNRLTTLHSAWRLWQNTLQQHQDLYAREEQALKQRGLTLQSRTWLHWKHMYRSSCCQKEKESKAALHFNLRLKTETLHRWKSHVAHLQNKKKSQAVVQRARQLRQVKICWTKWRSALHHKRIEEDRLQAAGDLAVQGSQRRALERWKTYLWLCREEYERNKIASQHHHHHLLRAGLQGLSRNVTRSKAHRLNHNMAVQHYCQTMTNRYWKFWLDRLEEAEDKSFQPLREMALTNYSTSLLSSCFHHWREKLAERRHMQGLEQRADVWFAERVLPLCFSSWVNFTLHRELCERRRSKAEVYNQQRLYTWAFYTWWRRSEEHKEQMLSERMAILHEERCHLQSWRQRTEQQINEKDKRRASDHLYLHTLLHKTMTQWKDNSAEIRDRRNQEQQACYQGDLCCTRWAVEKWKQFVQSQHVKNSRLKQMQRHHEVKLLTHTFVAWKKHCLQMSQIYRHAEELYRQKEQNLLRKVLSVWRENTEQLKQVGLMERRAQSHFQHSLQLKVCVAWREATTRAVSTRHQQREAVFEAQGSFNQATVMTRDPPQSMRRYLNSQQTVRLLRSFRRWRKETREARRGRMCMEKARRHHESSLSSKALKAWTEHHYQYHKNKVMKRQGILLLKLKVYQTYFELWKAKLQHRRREAEQTERALWHWSLTLQAKVLYEWRLCVTEQRRKQEQVAQAAQVYRDQLLREGVTCILTYAAHMNDLTAGLTQHNQEQRSRHLQRVVKRCAMRWKQRALCKPQREQEVKGQPPKKNVTFCLTTPGVKAVSWSDSGEQEEEELTKLTQKRLKVSGADAAPSQLTLQTMLSDLHPAPLTSTQQSVLSNVSPSALHTPTVDSPQETRDVLLPPSAFMTKDATSCKGPGDDPLVPSLSKQHASAHADALVREPGGGTSAGEASSALIRELLSIQLSMKTYQQDRKQLRAWKKLKEVLQSWLQTSGKDDQMEQNAVCRDLKELEERIDRLSTELTKRKPRMLLHAERIQLLQTVLSDHFAFTTSQQTVPSHSRRKDS